MISSARALMPMLLFALFSFVVLLSGVAGEHWAVIVVGSRGYSNYRHQADACHAYHVVRRHGIPEENVVLMMYDDVAHHEQNPFPGTLFNRPTGNQSMDAAVDVYRGCQVDYRGDDVTPEMFVNVLMGDKRATKGRKVLESGPNDRVFVNFVDHGARGYVVFPHGRSLKAKVLRHTLERMSTGKRYKELVFYMEACESGSMFSNRWLRAINAYVTTAANGHESSWGTFCPPHDIVNGTSLDTCLGDLYSVNWMQDSDKTDLTGETLQQQYSLVKSETRQSHVQEFGGKAIRKEIVANFQSTYDQGTSESAKLLQGGGDDDGVRGVSAVDEHDIQLLITFYRYLRLPAGSKRQAVGADVISQIARREEADNVFSHLNRVVEQRKRNEPDDVGTDGVDNEMDDECYERVTEQLQKHCSGEEEDIGHGFSSYSVKYSGVVSALCQVAKSINEAEELMRDACFQESNMLGVLGRLMGPGVMMAERN